MVHMVWLCHTYGTLMIHSNPGSRTIVYRHKNQPLHMKNPCVTHEKERAQFARNLATFRSPLCLPVGERGQDLLHQVYN